MGVPEKRATLTTHVTAIPSASMPGSPSVSSILVLLLSSYSYDQIGQLCRFLYHFYQRILSVFVTRGGGGGTAKNGLYRYVPR